MKCPRCGEACTRDMVDVGVGEMPSGPWGCENCHWVEPPVEIADQELPMTTPSEPDRREAQYQPSPSTRDEHAENLEYLARFESDEALEESLAAGAAALRASSAREDELKALWDVVNELVAHADTCACTHKDENCCAKTGAACIVCLLAQMDARLVALKAEE